MGVGPQVHSSRWRAIAAICAVTVTSLFGVVGTGGLVTAATAQTPSSYTPPATGELDCNGFSPVQKPLRPMLCTDIRGDSAIDNSNTWGGRFYDNGHYIGHDEPDATFLSNQPGSGGDVTWTLTIGRDRALAPTDANPGHDVSHWFELSPAPWFSMALCDPNSFPQAPCTPNSDSNAPTCFGPNCTSGLGGGSAFMELQLYPPGNPPFIDSASCDDVALVCGPDHRQPRVHGRLRRVQHQLRGARQCSFHTEERRANGRTGTAGLGLEYLYTQQRNAPYEPRRHDQDPHDRRAGARRR